MPRARKFPESQEREIGAAVKRAREKGIPWKILVETYGLGRLKLWELAKGLQPGQRVQDVREHLKAGQSRPLEG